MWIFKDYEIESKQPFVWLFSCFLSMGHSSSYNKVDRSYICNLLISNEYGIFLRQKFINCYTDILFVNEDVFTMEMGRGIWREMSAEKRVHYVFTIHILTANFDKKKHCLFNYTFLFEKKKNIIILWICGLKTQWNKQLYRRSPIRKVSHTYIHTIFTNDILKQDMSKTLSFLLQIFLKLIEHKFVNARSDIFC